MLLFADDIVLLTIDTSTLQHQHNAVISNSYKRVNEWTNEQKNAYVYRINLR